MQVHGIAPQRFEESHDVMNAAWPIKARSQSVAATHIPEFGTGSPLPSLDPNWSGCSPGSNSDSDSLSHFQTAGADDSLTVPRVMKPGHCSPRVPSECRLWRLPVEQHSPRPERPFASPAALENGQILTPGHIHWSCTQWSILPLSPPTTG